MYYAQDRTPNATETEQVRNDDDVSLPPLESITDEDEQMAVFIRPNEDNKDDAVSIDSMLVEYVEPEVIHSSSSAAAAAAADDGFLPRLVVLKNSIDEHIAKDKEHLVVITELLPNNEYHRQQTKKPKEQIQKEPR